MNSPLLKANIYTAFVLFSTALMANAQKTAFDALEAFGKNRGQGNLKQVVGVTGTLGQDQPQQWLILMRDAKVPNLMHEYAMKKGKIVGERHFSRDPKQPLPSTPLPLKKLDVDSTKAFQIANQSASASNVGFDSISYLLRVHKT
ncbi:MAG: hypothetical protein GXP30_13490, partial [Verrucomicrobia bacterium]|nr:hypothetical protein [Verrucomicrobiota bacterium]